MKAKLFLLTLTFTCILSLNAQKTYKLQSPDSKLTAEIVIGTDIRFSLTHEGTAVLAPSPISMTLQNGIVLGKDSKIRKASNTSINQTIPTTIYKKREVKDQYNETTLSFRNNYGLIFRLYNDGLAYRFTTNMKDSIVVMNEEATYNFSKDHSAIVPYIRDWEKGKTFKQQFFNSFENQYTHEQITKLNNERLIFLPLLVELDAGKKLCITDADIEEYPGMFLHSTKEHPSFKGVFANYPKKTERGNLQITVSEHEAYIAKTKGTRTFPWRSFVVSVNDAELANNDMVFRLAAPSRIADPSWIKPGKVAWEWWSASNLYGVDFRAGMNNETYKYFIDFASENKIEYVILDGGWYKDNLLESVPAIDIKELVRYGESKQVGIILWAGFAPFQKDIEKIVSFYAAIGVKGFKVDFMDRDDQKVIQFLYDAAKLCADHQMLLDYHGICKPTGIQRTYPNVLNFEGVNGLEQLKWSPKSFDMVTNDVTIPFIRMLAGPMDYTQGAMKNATRDNYHPLHSEPMSQGTRCRQLAAYIIFESPMNMLCDNPSNYRREQECTDFIAQIPTVWDETVALDGKVGEYIALARQTGNEWYVGAFTDWNSREMELDLSFLGEGAYQIEIFKDGINADRAARDYKKEVIDLPAHKKIKISMAPGGGFAARIYKP